MPIRLRLSLMVTVIASVLVLVGGALFEVNLSVGMRATLEDFLRRSAHRLERDLADGRAKIVRPPQHVQPVDDQSTLQVLLRSGQVVYTTTRAGSQALVTASERRSALHRPVFVQRSRAVWHDPRLVLVQWAPGRPDLVLVVGASLDELINARSRLLQALLVGGPLIVAIVGVGSWLLAGVALRPVDRLRREAMAISASDPERRLAVPAPRDEVARLAHTLNDLLDLLQGAIARQREFVALASHELRTPLAVLRAEVELALRPSRTQDEMRASFGILEARIGQLVRLSDDLLILASGDEGALKLYASLQELEPLAAASLQSHAAAAKARGAALVLDAEPGVEAWVDAVRCQQIFDNLVANALDHATGTPLVELRVRRSHEEAIVEVCDRGPGFPEAFLPRAFERFTRGAGSRVSASEPGAREAPQRRGVGLGLAVVRLLVEAHGGAVRADNRPDGGASVVVRLPGAAGAARPAHAGDPGSSAPAGAPAGAPADVPLAAPPRTTRRVKAKP